MNRVFRAAALPLLCLAAMPFFAAGCKLSAPKIESKKADASAAAAAPATALKAPGVKKADDGTAIIRLKNGNAMNATILSEDAQAVVLDWEGSQITLQRSEIADIERARKLDGEGIFIADKALQWEHVNNPVIRLTNGQVLDAVISEVKGDVVTLAQDLGDGAFAYTDLDRSKIESLEFRTIVNDESVKIEEGLIQKFPRKRVHRLGMFTLVTDSEGSSLKTLKSVIRDQTTAMYFDFFPLLKGRQSARQNFVVVFDDIEEYFRHASADGVPALMCPGYFLPKLNTLFMVNYFGEQFTARIYESVQEGRAQVEKEVAHYKGMVGEGQKAQVQGIGDDINRKIETAYAYMGGVFADISLSTLRHELTHEFMHNYGLQTVLVSEMKGRDEAMIKKKKELVESKDLKKKKELLGEIIGLKKKEFGGEYGAANSWFVEGLAEYSAHSALGLPNTDRLYALQEARKKNELWPLEQLTVYKSGSFPGVASGAALSGYAQSWSFVEFLMKKHRAGFLKYLERMSRETASADEDIRWLTEALGVELRPLEKEWHAYIDTLDRPEDPEIERFVRIQEILGVV